MLEYNDDIRVSGGIAPKNPWEKLGMTEAEYDEYLEYRRDQRHDAYRAAAVSALESGVKMLQRLERRSYTQNNPDRAQTLRIRLNSLAQTLAQLRYEVLLAVRMQDGPWKTARYYTARANTEIAQARAYLEGRVARKG